MFIEFRSPISFYRIAKTIFFQERLNKKKKHFTFNYIHSKLSCRRSIIVLSRGPYVMLSLVKMCLELINFYFYNITYLYNII